MNWLYLIMLISLYQEKPYVVIFVQGQAFLNRNNVITELRQGSTVYLEDKVQFKNSKGVMRLAGKGGTFNISGELDPRGTKEASSGIWATFSKAMVPTVVTKELKARAGSISSLMEAETVFREFNTPDKPMLILDTIFVPVSQAFIKDTAVNFFYLAYQKDSETINKRLPFKVKGLILNISFDERLFLVDGKKASQNSIEEAKLYYYETLSKKSVYISSFNVRYKPFDSLRQELCLIANFLRTDSINGTETDAARIQTLNYLLAYYGRLDESLFFSNYFPKLNCKR